MAIVRVRKKMTVSKPMTATHDGNVMLVFKPTNPLLQPRRGTSLSKMRNMSIALDEFSTHEGITSTVLDVRWLMRSARTLTYNGMPL